MEKAAAVWAMCTTSSESAQGRVGAAVTGGGVAPTPLDRLRTRFLAPYCAAGTVWPTRPSENAWSRAQEACEVSWRPWTAPLGRRRRHAIAYPLPAAARRSRAYEVPSVPAAFRRGKRKDKKGRAAGARDLEELMAPPVDLLFQGPFAAALATAKTRGLLLLINLQNNQEFASHQLNRDTWSDAGVRSVVQGGFVLWQQWHDKLDAMQVASTYNLRAFPCVGVVDSRTGEMLWQAIGFVKPAALVAQLTRLASEGGGGGASAAAAAAAPAPAGGRVSGKSREDEMMAAAIQASLRASSSGDGDDRAVGSSLPVSKAYAVDSGSDSDVYVYASSGEERAAPARAAPAPVSPRAKLLAALAGTSVPSTAPVAVEAGPDATRVQLRLPSGRRVVRLFKRDDRVAALYALAAVELGAPHTIATRHEVLHAPDAAPAGAEAAPAPALGVGDGFDLLTAFPSASLAGKADQTLVEAGVANASLLVKLVEKEE